MAKRKGDEKSTPAPKKKPSSVNHGEGSVSRAVYACKRCRTKKIKCDLNYPSCDNCTKRGLTCVGLDPTTGREVPRTYTSHLEDRISRLESLLRENGVDYAPTSQTSTIPAMTTMDGVSATHPSLSQGQGLQLLLPDIHIKHEELTTPSLDVHSLLNEGTRSAGSLAPSLYLDSQRGISFSRLMYTAVRVNRKGSTRSLTGGPEMKATVQDHKTLPTNQNNPVKGPFTPQTAMSILNNLNNDENKTG